MLAGVARGISRQTVLTVHGHHHEIDGLTPELLERAAVGSAAPFYLLNGAVLQQDVKAGEPVTLNDVDLSGLETYRLYAEGLKL